MTAQQLSSVEALLLEVSHDRKWNNLKTELIKYQTHLKLRQQWGLNNVTNNESMRPTKPPLRLKSNSVSNELNGNGNGNGNAKGRKNNNKNSKTFPTKPPMRLKPSQSNKSDPLLRLFIRSPTNNNNKNGKLRVQTMEIVIWNGDNTEIEQVITRLCYKNNKLLQHKNDIKNTILDLL